MFCAYVKKNLIFELSNANIGIKIQYIDQTYKV